MNDVKTIHRFAEQNMLVERYLLRELAGADLEDFEQHLFQCAICFEAVKAGKAFTESLASVYLRKGSPGLMASLWQRVREFCTAHFSKAHGGTLMSLLLLSGPGPVPEEYRNAMAQDSSLVPLLLAGVVILALAFSALLRYNERFREFWARHVCDFMEEHTSDDTKGGA